MNFWTYIHHVVNVGPDQDYFMRIMTTMSPTPQRISLNGKRLAAFSLMELLVVITIIALLVALLIPTIQMVRQSAYASTCQHNLKQLHVGVSGYALDWGVLPATADYNVQVLAAEYLDSAKGNSDGNLPYDILKCRADRRPLGSPGPAGGAMEGPGYMQCGWANASGLNITGFSRVWSSYCANANALNGKQVQARPNLGMFWDSYKLSSNGDGPGLNLHKQGVNMVFGDGHCAYLNFAPTLANEPWCVVFWAVDLYAYGIHHVGYGFVPTYSWVDREPWK